MHGRADDQFVAAMTAWLDRFASANTRMAYRGDLEQFAKWCVAQGHMVLTASASDIARYQLAAEASGLRPSTVARRMSALSSFFDHATASGTTAANPMTASPHERPMVERHTSATERLQPRQLRAVEHAAASLGTRESVLVALLAHHGLKLADVLALDARDVTGRPPTHVAVRTDKGVNRVPLAGGAAAALATHVRGSRTGPLLDTSKGRLSRYRADQMLRAVGTAARLPFPLSSNVLRRTHAHRAHAEGEGLHELRDRLGHRDVRTTRRYLPVAASTPADHHGDGRGLVPSSSPRR